MKTMKIKPPRNLPTVQAYMQYYTHTHKGILHTDYRHTHYKHTTRMHTQHSNNSWQLAGSLHIKVLNYVNYKQYTPGGTPQGTRK